MTHKKIEVSKEVDVENFSTVITTALKDNLTENHRFGKYVMRMGNDYFHFAINYNEEYCDVIVVANKNLIAVNLVNKDVINEEAAKDFILKRILDQLNA